jgi:CspA family cold shock protein
VGRRGLVGAEVVAVVVARRRESAQVKWYDPKKGFGFVAVDGSKDVFIHRSVLAREGINELAEGQRIHMKVVPGQKGLEAIGLSLIHD